MPITSSIASLLARFLLLRITSTLPATTHYKHASCYCALQARFLLLRITSTHPAIAHCKHGSCDCALQARFVQLALQAWFVHLCITTIIIILIKCYSLTALYKHLITKSTLTYISTNKSLNIVVYRYCLSNNIYLSIYLSLSLSIYLCGEIHTHRMYTYRK